MGRKRSLNRREVNHEIHRNFALLLVLSIQVDAAKKKLLKKLAKELGYKLEEALEQLKVSIRFDAYRTSVDFENASGSWETITYTGLRESSGSGMDINTGVFTAPLAAIYEFHYEAEYYPGFGGITQLRLVQDGTQRSYVYDSDPDRWDSLSGTAILVLQKGSKVWVDLAGGKLSGNDLHFTGKLVAIN